jgi:hypothetical protein
MKRLIFSILILTVVALPALAQRRPAANDFASDFQTVPVMGNTPGFGGTTFLTYVAILNPTATAYSVTATLYDAAGTKREAMISLAAGEQKVYANFLAEVFNFTGGGAVTFKSSSPANRFIIGAEVRTSGTNFSTTIPALEFAGSNSRSFVAGVTVDSTVRTNIGCFNQSDAANNVKATILDKSGATVIGTANLSLPANAWGQTTVTSIVSNGYVQFDPAEAAVCYAVIVNNATSDGRFMSAAEYRP